MKFGMRHFGPALCALALCLFLIGCGASDGDKDKDKDKKASQNTGEQGRTMKPVAGEDQTKESEAAKPSVAEPGNASKESDTAQGAVAPEPGPQADAPGDQPDLNAAARAKTMIEVSRPEQGTAPRPSTVVAAAPIIAPEVQSESVAAAPILAPPTDAEVAAKDEEQAPAAEAKPAEDATESQADTGKVEGDHATSDKAGSDKTGDWPMWGGDKSRNMVNATTNISLDFDPEEGKNILWTGPLGSQTYGNPVVAGGRVYVGTNNGAGLRPKHPAIEDRGILLCYDEKTGEFLWQLTRKKLESGRVNDWPLQGICSAACVVDDYVYVVTNRCELMCLDAQGFHDGENDGPYQDEEDSEELDADIIWSLDMITEFGVFPHNLATSSPVVYEDMVYVLTSNGVDEAHLELPSPRSPCFMAVDRMTGEMVWANNDPFDKVLHGQWSSPAIGIVNGRAQVYFPGGDGILRALDAKSGDEIWRFDLNPKDTVWELGGRGSRNAIISTPVFYENSVILGVGQDPEHGEGVGHLWRIDATKTGDISAELGEIGQPGQPNPNSGVIWHYGGEDESGEITGEEGNEVYRRTMSTVAIADGLVIAPDLSGRVHCIDFKTGKRYWEYDLLAELWGSPMVVDGKVLLGDENGDLNIFELSKEENEPKKVLFPSSIYSTPTIANGVMFISDRSTLYAIKITE